MFIPHWPPRYPKSGKIEKILKLLGDPHKKLPPVIHVTGTNGKGSLIAFLRQIYIEHGFKVHAFTSPHLLKFNENFTITNNLISDSMIFELTEEIRQKLEGKIQPGFFEYQTALAFLAFSRHDADICIVESGMGAKNDPTNILESNFLAIFTPISLDHQEFLGESIEEISLDKAYLIKPNSTVISAPQNQITKTLLTNFTTITKAQIVNYEEDYDFDIDDNKLAFVDILKENISHYNLPKMLGEHQIVNLATALAAIKNQTKFKFEDELINTAIKNTTWPARLEKITHINNNYIPNNSEVYFDGAHNESGAIALSNWIKEQGADNKKNIIIYGRSQNRDHDSFLKHLSTTENEIIFITVQNEPNPEREFKFKMFLSKNPQYNIKIFDSLEDAFLNYIAKLDVPIRVLICGSLYLYRDLHKL